MFFERAIDSFRVLAILILVLSQETAVTSVGIKYTWDSNPWLKCHSVMCR